MIFSQCPLTRRSAPIDSASYARSVREDTAELASYVLSDKKDKRSPSFLRRGGSGATYTDRDSSSFHRGEPHPNYDDSIAEVSEPSSLDTAIEDDFDEGPSMLTSMLKNSPPESDTAFRFEHAPSGKDVGIGELGTDRQSQDNGQGGGEGSLDGALESTPLLIRGMSSYSQSVDSPDFSEVDDLSDVESQKPRLDQAYRRYGSISDRAKDKVRVVTRFINPKTWNGHAIWQGAVMNPLSCLPSVVVGLLLNILDALSYGKRSECRKTCVSLIVHRNDFIPTRQPGLRQLRPSWNIHVLRQHYCVTARLLYWQRFQRRSGI